MSNVYSSAMNYLTLFVSPPYRTFHSLYLLKHILIKNSVDTAFSSSHKTSLFD